MAVTGFPTTTAGVAHSFTVRAMDAFGNVAVSYVGTVHFTSSDSQAALPADYALTTTEQGTHIFSATLKTAGAQSITSADIQASSITGSQTGITVRAATATRLTASAPANVRHGVSFNIVVTAFDAFGNVATGYTGTIHFTSTDGRARLPANFTFTASNAGKHIFSVILRTTGTQTITATDTASSAITATTSGILVAQATLDRLFEEDLVDPEDEENPGHFDTQAVGEEVAILTGRITEALGSSNDPGTTLPGSAAWLLLCAGGLTWRQRSGSDIQRRVRSWVRP